MYIVRGRRRDRLALPRSPEEDGGDPLRRLAETLHCGVRAQRNESANPSPMKKQHFRFDKRGCNTSLSPFVIVNNSNTCIYT